MSRSDDLSKVREHGLCHETLRKWSPQNPDQRSPIGSMLGPLRSEDESRAQISGIPDLWPKATNHGPPRLEPTDIGTLSSAAQSTPMIRAVGVSAQIMRVWADQRELQPPDFHQVFPSPVWVGLRLEFGNLGIHSRLRRAVCGLGHGWSLTGASVSPPPAGRKAG